LAGSSASLLLAMMAGASPPATFAQFEAVMSQDSATRALEQWYQARHIAAPAVIHAEKLSGADSASPETIRRRLDASPFEPIAVRHVRLSCGKAALSVAWNWYLPARLTPEMNAALRDSDVPFGKVVAPLQFRRESLPTLAGRGETCPAGTISTHRARLVLPDGRALAYVIECYTAANLRGGAR
jgi:hypothetical protein